MGASVVWTPVFFISQNIFIRVLQENDMHIDFEQHEGMKIMKIVTIPLKDCKRNKIRYGMTYASKLQEFIFLV